MSGSQSKMMFIQLREFFSLFFDTLFVIPLPLMSMPLTPLANLSTPASGSMHFSLNLLLDKLRSSMLTLLLLIVFAKFSTPLSVILFPERLISFIHCVCWMFLLISLTLLSPIPLPLRLRTPSFTSLRKAEVIADSLLTFLAPDFCAFGFKDLARFAG